MDAFDHDMELETNSPKRKLLSMFIVDDNIAYITLLKDKFLQKGIYEINTFTSGEECLENLNLKPDIVVLDYHLTDENSKGLDGHQVLEIIMQKLPRTKVIMISGDEKIQLLSSDFDSLGASNSLLKSYDTATKIKVISNELIEKRNRKHAFIVFLSLLVLLSIVIAIVNFFY